MKKPYFSIIVPSYNRAHLIVETIHAILKQEFTDFELLLIDDASTDDTEQVIRQFADERIQYHRNEFNLERSASRNKGIDLANGKYICFCDSDDHWKSNHLHVLYDKITAENEPVAMFFTGMVWNFPDRKQEVIFPSPEGKNLIEYVIKNQIAPSTVSVHKEIVKDIKFNTKIVVNEDVEFFSHIVVSFPLFQVPFATIDFMIHAENTKGMVKNYISPQLLAMEIIFRNESLKNKISNQFKRQIQRDLRHQLINFYNDTDESNKLVVEIIRFLFKYPRDWQNKSKIYLLLTHIPGLSCFFQKSK